MSQDAKRVVRVLCGAFGLTLAIMGLVLLWFGRASIMDWITEMQPSYSALEVDLDELHEGDHVTVETSVVADYVMEKNETLSSGGYINYQTTWRYYLVPIIESDRQGIYIDHMVLVSRRGNFKELNDASDAFFEWWNDENSGMDTMPNETVLSVDGRVVALTSKELDYVEDYFGNMDYEDLVAPYVIRPLWDGGDENDILMDKFMLLTEAGFFVFGLILLLIALLVGRKKPRKEKVGLSDTLRHGSPEFEKYMNDVIKKLSEEQKSEIMYLIYGGRTLEAIKLFRDTTGVGLAHAKDVIDHYNIYLK